MKKVIRKRVRSLEHHLVPNVGTVLAVALLLFVYNAWAAPQAAPLTQSAGTDELSYQGQLLGSGGSPVNGQVEMTFRIYNVPTGGTALWTEAHTGGNSVPVDNGRFQVLLGSLTPIPSSVWEYDNLYLEVQVGSEVLSPRELLGGVPVAGHAWVATMAQGLSAPDGDPQNVVFVDNDGDVGVRTTNPTAPMQIGDPSVAGMGRLRLIGSRANQWEANNLFFGDDGNPNRYWMNTRGGRSDGRSWVMFYDNREIFSGVPGGQLLTPISISPVSDGSNEYTMHFHNAALNIGTNGYIGIGTTGPAAPLHLYNVPDVSQSTAGLQITDKDDWVMRLDGNEIDSTDTLCLQKEHRDKKVIVFSDLDVRGNIIGGGMVERNLLTPDEQESERVERFEVGDLLCWNSDVSRLEKCAQEASPLVVAVANEKGQPIILGAELVKVIGPVQPGDLLVASDVPGYAVSWSQVGEGEPPMGVVIAKALEAFNGEQGTVKAMILTQ